MIVRTLVACLAFLLGTALAAAQPQMQVSATVDRTTIRAGESLRLTVTIDGGQGEVDTSAITDFKVIPHGSSTRLQMIDGHTLRQVSYAYTLIPADLRGRRLTIPALTATVDGKTYTTRKMSIRVETAAAPDDGGGGRDVWVTAAVSTGAPFAGQQIIYTVTLYNAVQVTDARFQPPEFQGFLAREIGKRRSQNQVIDGREVAVAHIDYVLVPPAAGRHAIEPASIQVGVVQPGRQRRQTPFDDFFDSPFLDRRSVTPKVVQTQPLTVEVQPLPQYTGALPFSGLVGRFELAAQIEAAEVTVGDSTTLAITLQGEGNIMDARLPELTAPEGLKSYADAPVEEIALNTAGYAGRKVFRIALVPVKPGTFELPPVEWVYFDVARKAYRTLSATLPVVHARPGAPDPDKQLLVQSGPDAPQKQAVQFTGRDILPLKEGLDTLVAYRQLSGAGFVALLLAPALLFGGVLGLRRVRRSDLSPSARMKVRARRSLADARTAQHDPQALVALLYRALTAAILASAGRSGEALTWKEAELLLIQTGIDPQIAREAAQTLCDIESAKFSGAAVDVAQASRLLARSRELIRRLAA